MIEFENNGLKPKLLHPRNSGNLFNLKRFLDKQDLLLKIKMCSCRSCVTLCGWNQCKRTDYVTWKRNCWHTFEPVKCGGIGQVQRGNLRSFNGLQMDHPRRVPHQISPSLCFPVHPGVWEKVWSHVTKYSNAFTAQFLDGFLETWVKIHVKRMCSTIASRDRLRWKVDMRM